jgi:hypothetical protein
LNQVSYTRISAKQEKQTCRTAEKIILGEDRDFLLLYSEQHTSFKLVVCAALSKGGTVNRRNILVPDKKICHKGLGAYASGMISGMST